MMIASLYRAPRERNWIGSAIAGCLFVVAALAGPTLALANEGYTGPWGGPGGAPFALRCPAGTVVVGLAGRQGAWIDQIGPVCSDGARPGVAGGQGGGSGRTANCPQGSMVRRVYVSLLESDNHLVDEIGFTCVSIASRTVQTATVMVKSSVSQSGTLPDAFKDFYQNGAYIKDFHCGPDDIIGIQGRAGTSVDAIGLICGDRVTPDGPIQMANPVTLPSRGTGVSIGDPATCKQGFVWREAVPGDRACVPPVTRAKNQRLNSTARFRSVTGAVGGNCINGFVWREATSSDQTCVSPEDRSETRQDNGMAAQRRIGS